MEVISAKIEKETKERMRKLPYINWSEVIREMLKARIEKEEARQKSIDRSMVRKGTELAGSVRRA